MKIKPLQITLKITAIFLWYFVALFFFIVWDLNRATPFFEKGTLLGDMVIRSPYQWDFELMFSGLFLIWGIYVWEAAKNPEQNKAIISFTAWGFLMHAVTMIIIGLIRQHELVHLANDSIYWFTISFFIFYFKAKK